MKVRAADAAQQDNRHDIRAIYDVVKELKPLF